MGGNNILAADAMGTDALTSSVMDGNILTVQTGVKYPIYFRHSYDSLAEAFQAEGLFGYKNMRKILVITDSNVAPLYLEIVREVLGGPPSFVFEAGEGNKNMVTLQKIYDCFLANKLDRRSVVVALGGGVTGDMAGYAAATYMRGLDYVQLPTSLLAQVDSAVGGKTAIDYRSVKNLVGSFHQPRLVYINVSTLKTLPGDEFISGMGEVVKHGLIGDGDYYEYLSKNIRAIKNLEPEATLKVVSGSCRIKAGVVAQDEKEAGLRETLNFGHCVGHAIESLSDYTLAHGCCVAVGMCAALQLSQKIGNITKLEADRAIRLIETFNLPIKAEGYKADAVLSAMYKDKKTINDTLRLVLLKKIGEAYTDNAVPLDEIKACISHLVVT